MSDQGTEGTDINQVTRPWEAGDPARLIIGADGDGYEYAAVLYTAPSQRRDRKVLIWREGAERPILIDPRELERAD